MPIPTTCQRPALRPSAHVAPAPASSVITPGVRCMLFRNWTELRVCVVEAALGADEAQFDGDAEPLASLDEVLAATWMTGAGLPGIGRRPRGDELLLRAGE